MDTQILQADAEERWRQRFSAVPLNVVVYCDGVPAGIVGAYEQPGGAVELISMWVDPAARGRGVGDAAVRAVVDWAGGRDVVLSVMTQPARHHALQT
jgi:GNAT superfamily N-acetyltransferase